MNLAQLFEPRVAWTIDPLPGAAGFKVPLTSLMDAHAYCSAKLQSVQSCGLYLKKQAENGNLQKDLSIGADTVLQQVQHFPLGLLCGWGVGLVTFRSSLYVACLALRLLRISNATPVLAPLLGAGSIATSSCAASVAMNFAAHILSSVEQFMTESIITFLQRQLYTDLPSASSSLHKSRLELPQTWVTWRSVDVGELCLYSISGLLGYRLFGGRFSSVAPSDLFHPGAFALRPFSKLPLVPSATAASALPQATLSISSIASSVKQAASAVYADTASRTKLQSIGKRHGCHSCGAKRAWQWSKLGRRAPGSGGLFSWSFHADHQPPVKYFNRAPAFPSWMWLRDSLGMGMKEQRFFPQCPSCSQLQAAACKTDTRTLIVHHATRLYHAWLPAPLLWLAIKPTVDRYRHANRGK